MISLVTLYFLASATLVFFLCAVLGSIYAVMRKRNCFQNRNNNNNWDVEKGRIIPTDILNCPCNYYDKNNQSRQKQLHYMQSLYSIDSNDDASSNSSNEIVTEWTSLLSDYDGNNSTLVEICDDDGSSTCTDETIIECTTRLSDFDTNNTTLAEICDDDARSTSTDDTITECTTWLSDYDAHKTTLAELCVDDASSTSSDETLTEWSSLMSDYHANKTTLAEIIDMETIE